MKTPIESPKLPQDESVSVEKVGRRRFLGAGSAVTPVILTMVSQPALGVTCFTPSRSLSKNTSVSQNDHIGNCTGAQSPGNYKAQYDPSNTNGGSFSWPSPILPTTPFHPTFHGTAYWLSNGTVIRRGNGSSATITTVTEAGGRSMTMWEVLDLGVNNSYGGKSDPGQVAFHLIGAYLNCLGGGGSSISPLAMTPEGVLKIWQEYTIKGYYEPMANVRWDGAKIKDYLFNNGIVT